jgi:hypothetical protein
MLTHTGSKGPLHLSFISVPSQELLVHVLTQIFFTFKERLPALVRDLFTFPSKVIKMFIIV